MGIASRSPCLPHPNRTWIFGGVFVRFSFQTRSFLIRKKKRKEEAYAIDSLSLLDALCLFAKGLARLEIYRANRIPWMTIVNFYLLNKQSSPYHTIFMLRHTIVQSVHSRSSCLGHICLRLMYE